MVGQGPQMALGGRGIVDDPARPIGVDGRIVQRWNDLARLCLGRIPAGRYIGLRALKDEKDLGPSGDQRLLRIRFGKMATDAASRAGLAVDFHRNMACYHAVRARAYHSRDPQRSHQAEQGIRIRFLERFRDIHGPTSKKFCRFPSLT